jgi:Fur family ferric uptake transcriptional regulator
MAEHLRKEGHRLTPQRLAVLEVIKAHHGHMTVNEVLDELQRHYPTITVPTVYRNLRWLADCGVVAETDLGEGCRIYEYIADNHHHHLVCQRCHRIIDLPDAVLDSLRETIHEEYGFVPCLEHVGLFGICPDCQKHLEQ